MKWWQIHTIRVQDLCKGATSVVIICVSNYARCLHPYACWNLISTRLSHNSLSVGITRNSMQPRERIARTHVHVRHMYVIHRALLLKSICYTDPWLFCFIQTSPECKWRIRLCQRYHVYLQHPRWSTIAWTALHTHINNRYSTRYITVVRNCPKWR